MTDEGKFITPQDRAATRISEEMAKANKDGRPFCEAAAWAELKERADNMMIQLKRNGYVDEKTRDSLKLDSVDWNKFSDLKNFELVEENKKGIRDEHLSKIHRLPVFVAWKKYKYRGFSNVIMLMENEDSAVERAYKTMGMTQTGDRDIREEVKITKEKK